MRRWKWSELETMGDSRSTFDPGVMAAVVSQFIVIYFVAANSIYIWIVGF